jgi:hypothetical protein
VGGVDEHGHGRDGGSHLGHREHERRGRGDVVDDDEPGAVGHRCGEGRDDVAGVRVEPEGPGPHRGTP